MAYITAEDLCSFCRKFPDEEDELPARFARGAQELVNRILGYNPERAEYTHVFYGLGIDQLALKAKPVTEIISVTCNGEEISPERLESVEDDSNYIRFKDGGTFRAGARYEVTYTAGWEEVPEDIRTAALQIGSIFWESANGNLAVSSVSFADAGTRQFNNYSEDRFIKKLSGYCLTKVEL